MARRRDAWSVLLPLLVAVLVLGAWHLGVVATGTDVFPSPLAVGKALRELANRGVLARYIGDSMLRVASGYLLALVLGIPLGLAMGWYSRLATALNPVVQILRPISPLAWIPVSIVFFGVTNFAAIFLIFLSALFPIVVATMNGVRNVPSMYLLAGRNFGLPPATILRRVVFPAALPQVLVGLRVALGISWLVVVAAEMIAVDSGLGYLVIDSRNAGKRYDLVLGAILLIGVIGLGLDLLARRVERMRRVRWGFRTD
jgi:NitT/TauT family transport system permease protein